MPSLRRKFPNYREMFFNALEFMMQDCREERLIRTHGIVSFLREYRTAKFNMGRQTGKTESVINFAKEVDMNVCIITMNSCNAKWMVEKAGFFRNDNAFDIISVRSMNQLRIENPNVNYDLIMVDESEFTLDNIDIKEFYQNCANLNAKYILMT